MDKILLVEDEIALAMLVSDNLSAEGYKVVHAKNGEEGLKAFYRHEPDLVILDVMMPKGDGFSVANTIRDTDRFTPILFLTAKIHVKDVVKGFESGGNDYLRKPFGLEELLIRIKVLLNGGRLSVKSNYQTTKDIGAYVFDPRKSELVYKGNIQKLTNKECQLLLLFCQNQERTLTKKTLLLKIWGDDSFLNSRSLDVFVSKLRKSLKNDPRITIVNIRGVGYKLMIHS